MKNTEGPWYLQHHITQDGSGGTKRWKILAGKDRSIQIASLKGWDDEDEANARLIAAAPDLLAACEEALVRVEAAVAIRVKLTGIRGGGAYKTVQSLRAAIAKARGK